MTNEEKAHLYSSHVISEAKLIHLSKSVVKGLLKGLKKRGFPCTICQHAKIIRKAAAPAATGSDPHCVSFDMIDMSKILTVTGLQYCTMIVERETQFAHIQLHATKDEIVQVFKHVLPMLTKKPLIIKSDCAPEYHTPELLSLFTEYAVKEVRHSNEHCQAQNGMVEKFGDTLGRGLRRALLQNHDGLPLSILGAAAMLITDIYNSCPHSSPDNDTPFFRRTGRLPDFSFFRPFGCGMMVFRGKDLVEHKKLALRGEKCVYIGTGRQFRRRAFMGYSPRTNRVHASVDCGFDDTYFLFRVCDQRVRGFFDTESNTEELSMFYDIPNATIEQIIERINSSDVPCNAAWGIEQVMTVSAEIQAVDSNLIHYIQNDGLAAYGLQRKGVHKSCPMTISQSPCTMPPSGI